MSATLLAAAGYRPSVWRNGLGTSLEIAAEDVPAGDEPGWRLALAVIERSCPFSAYPGHDRTILLLQGAGFALDLPGGGVLAVDDRALPRRFPGDEAALCRLQAGPVRVLNVFTRRDRFAHRAAILGPGQPLPDAGGVRALFALAGATQLLAAGGRIDLAQGDSVMLDAVDAATLGTGSAPAYAVAIDPVGVPAAAGRLGRPS